jgi:YggT family protein
MILIPAITRSGISNFVGALFEVYILLIFLYIVVNMAFSLGLRPPYARWSEAIVKFLRDVCEPYLRLFRRFIPTIGMFDFSPIIAILVLVLLDRVLTSAIGN